MANRSKQADTRVVCDNSAIILLRKARAIYLSSIIEDAIALKNNRVATRPDVTIPMTSTDGAHDLRTDTVEPPDINVEQARAERDRLIQVTRHVTAEQARYHTILTDMNKRQETTTPQYSQMYNVYQKYLRDAKNAQLQLQTIEQRLRGLKPKSEKVWTRPTPQEETPTVPVGLMDVANAVTLSDMLSCPKTVLRHHLLHGGLDKGETTTGTYTAFRVGHKA